VALAASALIGAAAIPIAASLGAAGSPAGQTASAPRHLKLSRAQRQRRLALRGRRGPRGPRGFAGPAGPAGITGPTGPARGRELVQNATVNWQNGQWQTDNTVGFPIPGIGVGQIVCTPPVNGVNGTTWLRVYPFNHNDYVTMWVLRQQTSDGQASAPTVRTAKYYPGAGIQDFNEGFNQYNLTTESTSTGAFQGLISDRGPYGSSGSSIAPTSFHLSFTWDFTDPNTSRCYVAAKFVTGG